MNKSMGAVVAKLAKGLSVRTSFPVTSITYGSEGARLSGPAGAVRAGKVIITVPLKVSHQAQVLINGEANRSSPYRRWV